MNKIKKIISKKNKTKIVSLTAYSKNVASILDNYCDIILVGDSLGSVLYNYKSTKKVTFNTICPGKIIKNYQHKRRRNKKMRKYITSEILSKKIFSIYFNKNKKINGKLFLLDKH